MESSWKNKIKRYGYLGAKKKKMLEIHAVLSLRAFLKYELSDNSMDMCIKSKSLIRITLLSKYLAER